MYFSIFYPLNLLKIKLIFCKNVSFLSYGFYMKHNQNKIIFLMGYNSSSFDDMKFLAYCVSRNYVTSAKRTSFPFKYFGTPFKFNLLEKASANFDALVIVCTIIDLNSPTISLPGSPVLFLSSRFLSMTDNRIHIDNAYVMEKVIQNILIFIEQKQRDNKM